jgi:hypothetical protein
MTIQKSLAIAAIGTDDGTLRIFEIDYSDLKKSSLKAERKVHKGRLMDLWIDEDRMLLFSIGEDRFLRTYCLQTGSILSGKEL